MKNWKVESKYRANKSKPAAKKRSHMFLVVGGVVALISVLSLVLLPQLFQAAAGKIAETSLFKRISKTQAYKVARALFGRALACVFWAARLAKSLACRGIALVSGSKAARSLLSRLSSGRNYLCRKFHTLSLPTFGRVSSLLGAYLCSAWQAAKKLVLRR